MRGNNVAEEICIHCEENEDVLIKSSYLRHRNSSLLKSMVIKLGSQQNFQKNAI